MKIAARVFTALLLGHTCFAGAPMTIAVWDYAGLPANLLEPAVEFARHGFEAAGMEAVWTICRPSAELANCSRQLPPDGHYLNMLVMPRMLVAPTKSTAGADVAGFAMVGPEAEGQQRAWAFMDAAGSAAEKSGRPVSLVLGCILAHEIAHVLGLSHRAGGIMRTSLSPRDLDSAAAGRLFDPWEARQLCAAAERLSRPASGTFLAARGR